MTARRRSRRHRPLTEFVQRSPLHALGVWLLRTALIALMFLALYLLITVVLVPAMADGFLQRMTD